MDLQQIEMNVNDAERAFREYRGEFMKHRNQIDAELMRGYKALSEGKRLISLTEAFQVAGLNEQGLPNIAVGRANEDHVMLDSTTRGGGVGDALFYNRQRANRLVVRGIPGLVSKWNQRAIAPIIPPRLRPPFSLVNYHLLWEVDKWTTAPQPRRDPALLKHIGGDLYAVLAVWDLTELESRILGLLRT